MIIELLWQNPTIFFIWVIAIVFAITIHEFSHALFAYILGDNTAKDQGRLTLNPFSHLDLFGFFILLIAGFGWGKPVPFNPYNLKNKKWGPGLIALAGPLSNLVAIIVFGITLRLIGSYTDLAEENLMVLLLVFLIQINMILMIFNLLPIPPLDGSKVLFSIMPSTLNHIKVFLERYGPSLILGLIIFDRLIILNALGFSVFGFVFRKSLDFIMGVIF